MFGSAVASGYSKDQPFPARIVENRLLSRTGSAKETRHFVVDLTGSGMHYTAGDSLGVFPENRPADVEEILQRLGASGAEPVSPPILRLAAPIPLRQALSSRLSLAKPVRPFVELLAAKATKPEEKAKLAGLLATESADVLVAFLEQREYVDLLAEFPSAQLSPADLVLHLRRLMPRLYSIASSSLVHPTSPHLTVAVVRYTTNGRERDGVCSTYLADRVQVGTTHVPVFVASSHFRLPADPSKDCIMVGPGTGIAPFRAFVQERVAKDAKGRNWIFFGDQRRATDFLYEEEWQEYQNRGQLARIDTAFSRDQPNKIYVQDRMRENAAELWAWLQAGAHFYVCGDAKRMAKDVDVALHAIVSEQGSLTPAAAADYVAQLKKDRRYLRDVY
jgi:sulfite reductase (NADPH) flavoprotein alpha-component